ncbi:hypothetical protein JHK84_048623 [Glycine max]|nr:hypothetical protein JHK85_049240 [Glycine max]KAG5103654.1 hypothetical protein JHK84_048623 [Glycine max]
MSPFTCTSSIIHEFNWRKVTAIYEHSNFFASHSEILTRLSYSLSLVNAEIDHYVAFPSIIITLSNPIENYIEQELVRLKNKSNRVFLLIQSSLEFSTLLFEKVRQMGMMEEGSEWIITDDVATHLDSLDSSIMFNMQGIMGCKTTFMETSETFKRFKFVFGRKFGLEYPEEENSQLPSIFALRAYDAVWTIAHALKKSQGNFFFLIRKYFTENLVEHVVVNTTTTISVGSARVLLGSVDWPGGLKTVPKGWAYNSTEGRPLKIGVPAIDPCPQFVNVSHDKRLNETQFTGFSINVFESVVKRRPYHLPFVFVPFYGSYDQIVEQVNNKDLDAAVGDIQVVEHRYAFAEFSHPYVESGIAMVVKVKADRSKETWMFMDAFTKEMWMLMAVMHLFIAFVIWFIEGENNSELKSLGAILWFSVTTLFFVHREPVKSNLARAVLAPWLFAILIVTSSFTASLSSMMTLMNSNSTLRFDSIHDFPRAFENKEIVASSTIVPHADVFIATYCKATSK